MMNRSIPVLLALCLFALCLAGCGGSESDLRYSDLVEQALDVSVEKLLTEAELSAIIGENSAMSLVGTYEEGAQALYVSETGAGSVKVNIQKMTRGGFDAMIDDLPGEKEAIGDVGAVAWWYDGLELFTYDDGYVLEVIVTVPGAYVPQEETLKIAATIFGHLQGATAGI